MLVLRGKLCDDVLNKDKKYKNFYILHFYISEFGKRYSILVQE